MAYKDFINKIKKSSKKDLKEELKRTSDKSEREKKEPKQKKDFGLIMALENKEFLIRNELRIREIKQIDKKLKQKNIYELISDSKEKRDKILKQKLR